MDDTINATKHQIKSIVILTDDYAAARFLYVTDITSWK